MFRSYFENPNRLSSNIRDLSSRGDNKHSNFNANFLVFFSKVLIEQAQIFLRVIVDI